MPNMRHHIALGAAFRPSPFDFSPTRGRNLQAGCTPSAANDACGQCGASCHDTCRELEACGKALCIRMFTHHEMAAAPSAAAYFAAIYGDICASDTCKAGMIAGYEAEEDAHYTGHEFSSGAADDDDYDPLVLRLFKLKCRAYDFCGDSYFSDVFIPLVYGRPELDALGFPRPTSIATMRAAIADYPATVCGGDGCRSVMDDFIDMMNESGGYGYESATSVCEAIPPSPPPPPTNPLLTGDLSATELAGDQAVLAVVAPIVGALLCLNFLFVIGVLLLHKRKRAVGFA